MRALRYLTLASVLALVLPAQAETMNEALSRAYTTNPDLESARAALRSVDELAPQARSGYKPSISASGSVGRNWRDAPTLGDNDYTSKVGTLALEQPLFRGGRTVAAMRQADSSIAAQRASLLGTEQNVLLKGVESYLSVVRDEAVLDLNKNNEEVLARQLQATKDRFSVGEVTKTDVSQAEARHSAAISARIQAEGQLTSSRAAYQRLFGNAPDGLKKPEVNLTLPKNLEEAVHDAEENNPSVVSAMNSQKAAEAALDGVEGERLPTISALAQWQHADDNGSSTYNRADTKTAAVSMNWPLYTGGLTSSKIRQAKQDVAKRTSDITAAERLATESATQAWEAWQTAKSTVDSRESQVKAAKVALDGVREEANVGSRTVLDTLDAEQEYLDAQVALVRAQHDEILAQYQLLAAVGRLTAKELQLGVEYYDETAYSNRVRNQWIGSSTGE